MKIKQQKQIKLFLIEEFNQNKGDELFIRQEKILSELIENTTNNLSKFATELKRSRQFNDLYEFKKTSKTLKEFLPEYTH